MKRILIVGIFIAVVWAIAKSSSDTFSQYSDTVVHYSVNPGRLSQPHAFLENRCDACHTPVKGVEASSCIVCHANDVALLQREPTAFHGNIGSCKECHTEHGGRVKHPIAMDHDALVQIGLRQLGDSSREEDSQSNVLAQYINSNFASHHQTRLNCAACHEKEDPHNAQFGVNCASCHETERWSIVAFKHPSPRTKDCAQCHQGPPCHRTTHFRDVCAKVADKPDAKVNECYSCHQSTAWNDIKGVGWYKSH